MLQKDLKLDFSVANHIRVWSYATGIVIQKLVKNLRPIFLDKVHTMVLDAELTGRFPVKHESMPQKI